MRRLGKMIDREISSSYLDEKIVIKWYQPESFTPIDNFHVCVMQDGNDYFQMGRIATLSDRLHQDGEIETTVFVGIHYQDRYDRQDKYHPKGSKHTAYKHFLIYELLPLLDEELQLSTNSRKCALMGDSLAGTLALMTTLQYPTHFDKIVMQSPYVDDTVLDAVRSANQLPSLSIYHTIGTKEVEVPTTRGKEINFVSPNRQLHQILKRFNANYEYHELEDGLHTWKYWQQDLPRALTFLFG